MGPIKHGVGVACQLHSATSYPAVKEAAGAVISINEDGTAQLLVGSADLGTGAKTVLAQIAAEELGIAFEHVRVVAGDTDVTPYDIGAYASRTTFISGGATQARRLRRRSSCLPWQPKSCRRPPQNLRFGQGVIRSKGAPAEGAHAQGAVGVAGRSGGAHRHRQGDLCAAQRLLVRCAVRRGRRGHRDRPGSVSKMVAVHDIGRAINPTTAEGQVEGALQQGIGFALMEDLLVDDTTGRTRNANFVDYKILTALDMPEIQVELLESDDELGPFGAKGVAEDGTCPTAAAIANAIYHATGVRMKELPITAERLACGAPACKPPLSPTGDPGGEFSDPPTDANHACQRRNSISQGFH